jgi:hypothetical protein
MAPCAKTEHGEKTSAALTVAARSVRVPRGERPILLRPDEEEYSASGMWYLGLCLLCHLC